MTFRTFLLSLTLCLFALPGFSSALSTAPTGNVKQQLEVTSSQLSNTGTHKISFKEKLALKLVQKKVQKMQKKMGDNWAAAPGIDKGVYIILAFLIPFLAVGLATNFEGNDWLIALLLSFLFWLPAIIYALIKMKDYYPS